MYPPTTERRKNPPSEHAMMLSIVRETRDEVQGLRGELNEHIKMEAEQTATAVKDVLAKSFPDGDTELHRRYHTAAIQREEARAKFWSKMVFELTKWGLIGFLGWLLVKAWLGVLEGPKVP